MGPLVPFGIIGPEFNYIVAMFIGLFFGYILEQAGFSTSKKLVGVFYGYDFVVLRVFFTAAITAVTGLLFLDYAGAIDISYLYINPTFLGPAIVGGAIMGLGFILGGFCPGTSVVAASTGKIDAWIFLIGSFIGILLFGEIYPMMKDFYLSGSYGGIFVYDSLGISRGLFAFLLILIAVGAFVFTTRIENKVKYGWKPDHLRFGQQWTAMLVAGLAALFLLILPDSHNKLEQAIDENIEIHYVTADEAAYDILNKTNKFRFVDLRDDTEYKNWCLTGAIRMRPEDVGKRGYSYVFESPVFTPVFYSSDDKSAELACKLAVAEGYNNCKALKGGIIHFKEMLTNPPKANTATFLGAADHEFWLKVRHYLNSDSALTKPKVKKKIEQKTIKVQGGC